MLDSSPGRNGGFRLNQTPRQIRLLDAIETFEPRFTAQPRCPFGNDDCSDADPCGAHDQWKKITEAERAFLRRMTLHDAASKSSALPRRNKRKARP